MPSSTPVSPRPKTMTGRRLLLAAAGLAAAAALIASSPAVAQAAPAGTGSFIVTGVFTGLDTPTGPFFSFPSSFYVDSDAGRLYVSEQEAVAVVDADNGEILNRVAVPFNYGSLAYDKSTDSLVVFQNNDHAITRIDRSSLTITKRTPIEAFGEGGNTAVNNVTGASYYSIDVDSSPNIGKTVGDSVLSRTYLSNDPLNAPQYSQPAIDEARNLVYILNPATKSIAVLDGASLQILRSIPTPVNYNSIAFDPNTDRLYASDSYIDGSYTNDGTMVIIDTTTDTVSAPVLVDPTGAGNVTVDPTTGRVLIATGNDENPTVSWFDPNTHTVLQTLPVPARINAFAWGSDGTVFGNTFGQSIVRLQYGVAPTITSPAQTDSATVGSQYSTPVTADGTGPIDFSISAGSLPDGLVYDPTTRVISGIPTTAGTATFTITATNAFGSDSREVTIQTLFAPAPTPVPTQPTVIPAGGSGSATLASTGSEPLLPVGIAGLALLTGAGIILLRRRARSAR